MTGNSDLLVVGLDGACWPLISDWLKDGELPNLSQSIQEGVAGDLQSCLPPVTCPAWKCSTTGKNPGELGVFWWETLDIQNKSSFIPDSGSFDGKEYWEVLNESGYSTGIIGMPTTFPPTEVDGFMVAGGPGVSPDGYTYPGEIQAELETRFDYRPRSANIGDIEDREDRDRVIEETLDQIDRTFSAAAYLHEEFETDVLHVCTFELNGPMQHFFYDGDPTKRAWKLVDEHIGRLQQHFESVLIYSDHGTSPMEKNFYVNAWLADHGYLRRKTTVWDRVSSVGITRDRLSDVVDSLGIKSFLARFDIAHSVANKLPDKENLYGEKEGNAIFEKVDWSETTVVGSAQGPLYLNHDILSEAEAEEIKRNLSAELESFSDPKTGKNPVESVYDGDSIYEGPYAEKGPDLLALDAPEYHNKGGIGKKILFKDSEWRGNNARTGLYVLDCDGRSIGDPDTGQIFDIAPTILDICGVSSPEDMDGSSLIARLDQQ